ncbi:MAG: hypothetical protein ACP5PB_08245, partial [Acidimicrobiales bacterium]
REECGMSGLTKDHSVATALAERIPEGALLALPDELRQGLGLPEEVGLTEDPEVSREDGFVLLAPGHPLLMDAAQSVFALGDVGWSRLPWPQGLPPTPKDLELRIREVLHPEHGRVDVIDAPESTYLLVLRVGALVTYRISVDEQVHELEEVWVATATGAPVPPELEYRLRYAAREPWMPTGIEPPFDAGVITADALIRCRARSRQEVLSRQTAVRLRSQLAVVDDYYRRVLDSIEDRRARAAADRAPLLSAQADATNTEWMRRRAEVADELRPTFEVTPLRLHVLCVPAYRTAAVVRRGERTYSFSVLYTPLTSSFLAPVCPSCGSSARLVAGKAHLGCQECVGPSGAEKDVPAGAPVADPTPSGAAPPGAAPSPGAPNAVPRPPAREVAPATQLAPTAGHPAPSGARARPSRRVTPKGSAGRVTAKGSYHGDILARTGSRLAMSFWESVLSNERINRREVAPNSPLEAVLRLYGSRGPAIIVGLRSDERPLRVGTSTEPRNADGIAITSGELKTSAGRELPFALYWRPTPTRLVLEVESFPMVAIGQELLRRDVYAKAFHARLDELLRPPPDPLVDLDAGASVLLRQSATTLGLSFAARCLAAWWYVTEHASLVPDGGGAPPTGSVGAAAIELIVAKRAGFQVTSNRVAERYGCPVEAVRKEARRLQSRVRGVENVGW